MDADLPDGWSFKRIEEFAEVVGGSTPSRARPEFFGGDIPWVTPTDITRLEGRYLDKASETVTDAGRRAAGLRILPARSILLTSRATIGATAIARVPVTTNQGFQSLVPVGATDSLWLYYAINQKKAELDSLASGSTFKEFSRQSLRSMRMLVPPPSQQSRIANILDAIDEAIEKTEAVVAATEDLRKALLQDLLTRGVPGWHTEWKTVQGIGTIPACWDVVRLGEVSGPFQYGTSAKCDDNEEDTPILRIPNVARGELELSDLKYAALPARDLEALRLQEGDLLFVRTNGNPDICGRTALVGQLEGDWAFASYLVRLRTSEDLSPFFLRLYLSQENGRRALSRHVRTSAGNFNLSVSGVRQLEMPLPPMPEQERVCELIRKVDDRLKQDRHLMTRIRGIKREIAGALLFGRVRVPVTTEAT